MRYGRIESQEELIAHFAQKKLMHKHEALRPALVVCLQQYLPRPAGLQDQTAHNKAGESVVPVFPSMTGLADVFDQCVSSDEFASKKFCQHETRRASYAGVAENRSKESREGFKHGDIYSSSNGAEPEVF